MQKLSISKQTFKRLREDDCVYVDKTSYVHKIMDMGGAFFLARPRRFGKSLFLSTLMELAEGNRALFEGTWIADKWDWSRKYPVINLEFAGMSYESMGLEAAISRHLLKVYTAYDIVPQTDDMKGLFYDLIEKLFEKHGKVVVLIDEYDKPILDTIEKYQEEHLIERQRTLKSFYSVLKGTESYIHCTFITGIAKFAKVSIFSDLNHLNDITFNEDFVAAYGYTQQELEASFAEYLQELLVKYPEFTYETLLEKIKDWYNGYSWDGVTRVYNPFGLLNFFSNKYFINSWFNSGTPTFLVRKLMEANHLSFENTETNINYLDFKSIENVDLMALMFQAGYLTIKELDSDRNAVLDYPNREVRESMYHYILDDMGTKRSRGIAPIHLLAKAFRQNDMERAESLIQKVFEELSYDVYNPKTAKQIEVFYHSIVNILFRYVGLYVQSEVHTTKGRADSIVETETHVYIFEFKLNKTAALALEQIQEKEYAKKYQDTGKTIVLIGANFSTETRYMDDWAVL